MIKQDVVRAANWIGFIGMLIALLDPMEGAFIALPFAAVLAYGAHQTASHYRVPLFWALGSMAIGVAVLLSLTFIGGIGGSSGRSMWWGLLLLPYPLGWLAALFLGARLLREQKPSLAPRRDS